MTCTAKSGTGNQIGSSIKKASITNSLLSQIDNIKRVLFDKISIGFFELDFSNGQTFALLRIVVEYLLSLQQLGFEESCEVGLIVDMNKKPYTFSWSSRCRVWK